MCCTSVGSCVEACTVISRPSPGAASGDLALEIEMLLAADGELAFAADAARRLSAASMSPRPKS